jgi:Skp family chaperone for outer membrane proteins
VLNVKKSFLLAAIAAIVVSIGYANLPVLAQAPGASRGVAPGPVALVDINYIMKNHNRRKAMMANMKADMEVATANVKSQSETIRKLIEQLKEVQPGTPDYKMRESQILKLQSDLKIQMQLQQKDFMQREAKVLYTVYQEIRQETSYYASRNNISMVMQFNGEPANTNNPQDVVREINQPVVWYAKRTDITPIILDALNGPERSASAKPSVRRHERSCVWWSGKECSRRWSGSPSAPLWRCS